MLNKYLTPISQPSYMEWVDWTKIIGIFLVTLGHGNLVSVELNTFIYSFHMPLFFILSGILFIYSIYNRLLLNILYVINQKYGLNL